MDRGIRGETRGGSGSGGRGGRAGHEARKSSMGSRAVRTHSGPQRRCSLPFTHTPVWGASVLTPLASRRSARCLLHPLTSGPVPDSLDFTVKIPGMQTPLLSIPLSWLWTLIVILSKSFLSSPAAPSLIYPCTSSPHCCHMHLGEAWLCHPRCKAVLTCGYPAGRPST